MYLTEGRPHGVRRTVHRLEARSPLADWWRRKGSIRRKPWHEACIHKGELGGVVAAHTPRVTPQAALYPSVHRVLVVFTAHVQHPSARSWAGHMYTAWLVDTHLSDWPNWLYECGRLAV